MPDTCHHGNNGESSDAEKTGMPSALLIELREHVPFSVTAVALGLIVAGSICILGAPPDSGHLIPVDHGHDHAHVPGFSQLFFHLFHPAHMLFSAAATTAMFRRYDGKTIKAVLIGVVGAIGVCGISDIAMPHVSLLLMGIKTPLHLCVFEHPELVLPFAAMGVLVGVVTADATARTTILSHSMHVMASSMASVFYMVGPLGTVAWIEELGKVFGFVVLAVVVPCCLSDIVFPLLMSRSSRDRQRRHHHGPA